MYFPTDFTLFLLYFPKNCILGIVILFLEKYFSIITFEDFY